MKLAYYSVQQVIWYFYYPVVSAQKPSGPVGSRKGHLFKESKALPRVHTGSTSPLFYAALTYTKAHVAMCDRALGGFPWLLISILTPLSHFLCGNKSHTKVHMWIYSWVRQEIRNLLTFYWDIYLKILLNNTMVCAGNIGRYFRALTKYCNFCWFFWSFEKKCHQKWRKHRVIIL